MSGEDTVGMMLRAAAYLDHEDAAEEILWKLGGGWGADADTLWCNEPYCSIWRDSATLDGKFTTEQLRLILEWIDLKVAE